MPILSNNNDTKLRYVSNNAPILEGWYVLHDLPDGEILDRARDFIRNKIKTEAEGHAGLVYGVPIPKGLYTLLKDLILSASGGVGTLRPKIQKLADIEDVAVAAIQTTSTMSLDQMDNYNVVIDPGWPQ